MNVPAVVFLLLFKSENNCFFIIFYCIGLEKNNIMNEYSMKTKNLEGSLKIRSLAGIEERDENSMKVDDLNRTLNGLLKIPKPILEGLA